MYMPDAMISVWLAHDHQTPMPPGGKEVCRRCHRFDHAAREDALPPAGRSRWIKRPAIRAAVGTLAPRKCARGAR